VENIWNFLGNVYSIALILVETNTPTADTHWASHFARGSAEEDSTNTTLIGGQRRTNFTGESPS
jgi:hypothetical protein